MTIEELMKRRMDLLKELAEDSETDQLEINNNEINDAEINGGLERAQDQSTNMYDSTLNLNINEEENEYDNESESDSSSTTNSSQESYQTEADFIAGGNNHTVEEIDNLLEEPIGAETTPQNVPLIIHKRVLQYKGTNYFDVLPAGWVEITHSSGLPVYFHKPTRCCTFSRPYFIGPTSVRSHKVPESAIPCYFQRKILNDIEQEINSQRVSNDIKGEAPSEDLSTLFVTIKTAEDVLKSQLSPDDLYNYAKKCFKFKDIHIRRFGKWSDHRKFEKKRKRLSLQKNFIKARFRDSGFRPGLPHNCTLITIPSLDRELNPQQKELYMNPRGRTSVSVLHELIQKSLKCAVRYFFSETRITLHPYHCVVKLVFSGQQHQDNYNTDGNRIIKVLTLMKECKKMQTFGITPVSVNSADIEGQKQLSIEETADGFHVALGDGFGHSKKNAKLMAAKDAIENLIIGVNFDSDGMAICDDEPSYNPDNESAHMQDYRAMNSDASNAKIFDFLSISDPRIPELCARAGQPPPFQVLQEHLKRYSTFGDTTITTNTLRIRHQKHRFELKVGEHSVRVMCVNKREGKQKAAQAMLKKFYPESETWNSVVRLCGYDAQKQRDVKKNRESIVRLQGGIKEKSSERTPPNEMILAKLRAEMLKLKERQGSITDRLPNADFLFDN